jgi:hypothetical protein
VDANDKFCWHCGRALTSHSVTEHYVINKQVKDTTFQYIKSLPHKDKKSYIANLPMKEEGL